MKKIYILLLIGLLPFMSYSQVHDYTDGTDHAIADNGTTLVTYNVTDAFILDKVTLKIDLAHTYDGDLIISLISPNGTVVLLTGGNGGAENNYSITIFDDGATTNITAGSPAYNGTYSPEGNLSDFDGESSNGIWTIKIEDTASQDVGILHSFTLSLSELSADDIGTGPGGVGAITGSSDLVLWINADSKINTNTSSAWYDDSGRDHDFASTQSIPFVTVNGSKAYNFDGVDDYFDSGIFSLNLNPDSFSIFTASDGDDYNSTQDILSSVYNDGNNFYGYALYISDIDVRRYFTSEGSNGVKILENGTASYNFEIQNILYDASSTTHKSFYVDNGNLLTSTDALSAKNTSTSFLAGAGRDGSNNVDRFFKGKIGEIIMFNSVVNTTERIIISNYLSAKYNTPQSANDYYTQDNSANGEFDYNVAGIGQTSSTDNHLDSKGAGIVRINSASAMSDGDFLFWGEEANQTAPYDFSAADASNYYTQRLNAKWRISETGNVGTITLTISNDDLTIPTIAAGTAIKLVVSSASDFATTNKTSYDLTLDSNNNYVATGVDFSDGDYFTIEYYDTIVLDGTRWYNGSATAYSPDASDGAYKLLVKASADGNPLLEEQAKVKSVEVESNGLLEIGEGHSLEVSGDVVNQGKITVLSSSTGTGSLITKGSVGGNGTYEIQRYVTTTKSNGKYQLVSSPVTGAETQLFRGQFFNTYDEGQGDFNEVLSTTSTLSKGEGYVVKWDDHFTLDNGVNPIKYQGAPFTGDVNVDLYKTTWVDPNGTTYANTYFNLPQGFNLVGNPYPTSVNWDLVYDANDTKIDGACYTYNNTGVSGSWDSFIAVDPTSSGYTPSSSRTISLGQGFGVVLSTNANNTLAVPNSARTNLAGSYFSKKNSVQKSSFNFVASSNGMSDKVNFRVNDIATVNFDGRYDAYKFNSFGNTPTPFFASADGKRLSISSQPLTETVDLGFNMAVSGDVTFSLSDVEGFKEIILEDMQENTFTDLTKTDYTFNYNEKDAETGRFVLHFNREALSEVEELMGMNIYANGSNLTISSIEELKNVEVSIYSITGKLVYSNSFQTLTNEVINTNLSGVNILKLTSDKGEITSKLILR